MRNPGHYFIAKSGKHTFFVRFVYPRLKKNLLKGRLSGNYLIVYEQMIMIWD